MIVTVTLNPALDLTYAVAALVPHGTHRVTTVLERPGGKGLNVARVLHQLGEPVEATGLLGGPTGVRIASLLAAEGVPSSFVDVAAETRRTVAVIDPADATGFWEPGPTITPAEWATFVIHFRSLLPKTDVVTLSGSLPPGLPPTAYADLIALAHRAGVRTILDSSGPALSHGLTARPTVVKPNADELTALLAHRTAPTDASPAPPATGTATALNSTPPRNWVGSVDPTSTTTSDGSPQSTPANDPAAARHTTPPLNWVGAVEPTGTTTSSRNPQPPSDAHLAARARDLGAEAVVMSRGENGLLAIAGDDAWGGSPPERVDGNPTGAGDACVAALARGLCHRDPWPELLSDALALSAAAVAAPAAGSFDPGLYRRFRPLARVTPLRPDANGPLPTAPQGESRVRTHR